MANSGTVTAGSAALASQYNNLRLDVLDVSTGHTHAGTTNEGAKVAATGVSSGTAALGAVLTADGSGAAAFLAAGASGGILKYEEFTSSGSFVIPANASSSAILILDVLGAGAGGNSGQRTGAGTAAAGGAGGVGGGIGEFVFLASTFGTAGGTVTVTIGAGGAGGASKTTAGVGNLASQGGTTSFGTVNFKGGGVHSAARDGRTNYRFDANILSISPNAYTTANVASGSALPSGGKKMVNDAISGIRYSYGAPGEPTSNFYSAFDSVGIAAGGGGGGGVGSGGSAVRGGNGGKFYNSASEIVTTDNQYEPYYTFGNGASGGTVATAGSSVGAGLLDGAGGGGAGAAGSAGSGGNGALGGGGGGGGGGQAQNSGAGGAGGSGRVRVWVVG